MEENKKTDYLIVGQGIAGSMLSHFLLKHNKTVFVIDDTYANSSSNIAAGLFNPITGRRIVKTWMADQLFPFAQEIYQELEISLAASFYHKKNIFKVFTSIKEQNDWLSKSESAEFKNYVLADSDYKLINSNVPQPFGGFEITNSGYIDMAFFIVQYKEMLLSKAMLRHEKFDYSDVILLDNHVKYKNILAKKIIFCEGHKAINNPFFEDLPFVLTKGEMLTIQAPDLDLDKILSKGIFILPLGNDRYKVGSTYTWNEPDENPTVKGKSDLKEKLDTLISCAYEIIEHKAGIRPTVKDRRPFLGLHPDHSSIGIFNGMGTKGAVLSPFFANHFCNHLEFGYPLLKEVDIARFREAH